MLAHLSYLLIDLFPPLNSPQVFSPWMGMQMFPRQEARAKPHIPRME